MQKTETDLSLLQGPERVHLEPQKEHIRPSKRKGASKISEWPEPSSRPLLSLITLTALLHPPLVQPRKDVLVSSVSDSPNTQRWFHKIKMELKTSYRPGPSPGCPISWKHHGLLVCGDAGVNKSLALPVVQMCSTHNHAQYITPENNDKRPRYRFTYSLYS